MYDDPEFQALAKQLRDEGYNHTLFNEYARVKPEGGLERAWIGRSVVHGGYEVRKSSNV